MEPKDFVPWTCSPQKGTSGHCFMAQVWDGNGKAMVEVEPTPKESDATATARLIVAACNSYRRLAHQFGLDPVALAERDPLSDLVEACMRTTEFLRLVEPIVRMMSDGESSPSIDALKSALRPALTKVQG